MIHLPFGPRDRKGQGLVDSPAASAPTKQLTREEAQDVVDAATAILDGLKVLFVLADGGNSEARLALRQWREVLGRLRRL